MRIRLVTIIFLLATAVLPFTMAWIKTPLILALGNSLAVLGVMILIRAGQVSFGHAMYMCLSGYAVAVLSRQFHVDAILSILLGTTFSIAIGGLVGLFMVRYRGIFFGMLNLAFSMVLFSALGKFTHITGGSDGLRFDRPTVLGMALEREQFEWFLLYLSIVLVGFAAWFVHRYFRSTPGQAFLALKTNETRLEYLGISSKRIFWIAYIISAALCGLGGTLFALAQGLITPESGFWVRSAEIVFISILGGTGHVAGAFIGSFVFEFVKLYVAAVLTNAWQMALGFALILMIFVAPNGLVGLLKAKEKKQNSQRK